MKNNFDSSFQSPAESILQVETQALKLISSALPLEETLVALVRTVEAQSSDMLCSVLLLDADGLHLRHGAAPSLPSDFRLVIDRLAAGEEVGSSDMAAFRRERACVADIATDPLWANYRELALQHGLHTCWSKPILDADGRGLGTFAIYYRQPRTPQASDLWFVEIATHAAAIAIGRHENGERMRRWQNTVLEQENRLLALKAEVNGLLVALGRSARYAGIPSR